MYVRVARFDGVDPASIDRDMAQFREIVRLEAAPPGMSAETFAMLRDSVTRVISAADRQAGATIDLIFTETEEDARRVHDALDAMSPPDTAGRRSSVGVFEVLVDEQVG